MSTVTTPVSVNVRTTGPLVRTNNPGEPGPRSPGNKKSSGRPDRVKTFESTAPNPGPETLRSKDFPESRFVTRAKSWPVLI